MKKKVMGIVYTLFYLAIGAVCGGMIAVVGLDQDLSYGRYLLTMAGLLLAMVAVVWLHVAFHEAGHLIFGLLTGYRFASFRLGSLMLLKEDDELRLRRFKLPGTDGQCLMLPPEPVDGKIPYVLYGLGGVIVNVVLAAAALTAWLLLPRGTALSAILLMAAVLGFVLALANGLPLPGAGVNNDGRNILTMKKHPRAMEGYIHQMQINAQLIRGLRAREMDEALFPVPEVEEMDDCFTATAGVFAANRLLDEHRLEEAQALLEKILAAQTDLPDLLRSMAVCDVIYCELLGQNRAERLETLLTKEQRRYMQILKKNISTIRTEYALAKLRDRDEEKAQAQLSQFEKVAKTYPYPQEVESERELMALVDGKEPTDGEAA